MFGNAISIMEKLLERAPIALHTSVYLLINQLQRYSASVPLVILNTRRVKSTHSIAEQANENLILLECVNRFGEI